jgi:hypothetical protein
MTSEFQRSLRPRTDEDPFMVRRRKFDADGNVEREEEFGPYAERVAQLARDQYIQAEGFFCSWTDLPPYWDEIVVEPLGQPTLF